MNHRITDSSACWMERMAQGQTGNVSMAFRKDAHSQRLNQARPRAGITGVVRTHAIHVGDLKRQNPKDCPQCTPSTAIDDARAGLGYGCMITGLR